MAVFLTIFNLIAIFGWGIITWEVYHYIPSDKWLLLFAVLFMGFVIVLGLIKQMLGCIRKFG